MIQTVPPGVDQRLSRATPERLAESDYAYCLDQMRRGPRYDARRRMLCIPHRWQNAYIEHEWESRKFKLNKQTHEYELQIRPGYAPHEIDTGLAKLRAHFFGCWAAMNSDVHPLGEIWVVEYYTNSDGRDRWAGEAKGYDDAIDQASRQENFERHFSCHVK